MLAIRWMEKSRKHIYSYSYIIHICSGIINGRVLGGELLIIYTKIVEVNLFAFALQTVS